MEEILCMRMKNTVSVPDTGINEKRRLHQLWIRQIKSNRYGEYSVRPDKENIGFLSGETPGWGQKQRIHCRICLHWEGRMHRMSSPSPDAPEYLRCHRIHLRTPDATYRHTGNCYGT